MGQQTRKQRVLEQVERHRRQRNLLTLAIAVIIIAVIVTAVIFYPRPPSNPVQLPDYLSHCVFSNLVYHSHPNLTITINGQNYPLPGGTGTFNQSCPQPLHTHDGSGIIHVETDQDRYYTLGDWFMLWGYYLSNPTYTIFNSGQIFNYKTDSTHTLTMTVNGQPDTTDWQNLQFPKNAGTGSACVGGNCVPFDVVITYQQPGT